MDKRNLPRNKKINPDKCVNSRDYSCPECGYDDWIHKWPIIGWTDKDRIYGYNIGPEPCAVYECPQCFTKVVVHREIERIKELLDEAKKKEMGK